MADKVNGKGSITDTSQLFIYPKGEILTADDLEGFIKFHNGTLKNKYVKARNYYTGHHPILDQEAKELDKPDNRLVVNYPRYIVDTFNGFSYGIPPKITLDDDTDNELLQQFNSTNSLFDKFYELAKQVSIYGRSYFFTYQGEESQTEIAVISPERGFMIYDDTVAFNPIAFVMYSYNEDNNLLGSVYQADGVFDLKMAATDQVNPFKEVPAIEFFENEERQGTFENVETLVDAVNRVLSQKANNVDYFADAYMKILGAKLDEDTLKNIKDNRIINLEGDSAKDVVVDFLQKPDGDTTEENLVNRLNNLIFQISSVANITDETFGSANSGKALEYHLLSMRNLAANKDRKFGQALREFYRIIFSVGTVLGETKTDEWQRLKFQFNRNLPSNLTDEVDVAKNLEGIVSQETQLKTLSIVDDPKSEMDRMAKENKAKQDEAVASNANYDFEKKSGEVDGEEE
ncbi:phage portal protein [Lapidilactobacillus bayanensis]|uniref:phage portal protein n=1 Tax=Lapidilactobacillus bayanensis TaxID=2485998 RepID=UPI000F7988F9|nr:phage portal protein [Lapidilactobacillus bayanensis]